ncbi:MAG TPA: hypothetical protein VF773_09960 [Verrucomicrobiae bacterium]
MNPRERKLLVGALSITALLILAAMLVLTKKPAEPDNVQPSVEHSMKTRSTLVLAVLNVASSYSQNVERPASAVPDTVQFWVGPDSQWRIKTFAVDHDIHVYRLGQPESGTPISVALAVSNTKKHYGDVISKLIVLEFDNPKDAEEVQRSLRELDLPGTLELVKNDYAFYNPDSAEYKTKSQPQ